MEEEFITTRLKTLVKGQFEQKNNNPSQRNLTPYLVSFPFVSVTFLKTRFESVVLVGGDGIEDSGGDVPEFSRGLNESGRNERGNGLNEKPFVDQQRSARRNKIDCVKNGCTKVQNIQESRRKCWDTCMFARTFARTVHSLPSSWDSER